MRTSHSTPLPLPPTSNLMVLVVVGGHHVDTTPRCGQITPPPNGSTASTTAASTRTAATSHMSNWRRPTTLKTGDRPPAEFSDQKVSRHAGAVHYAVAACESRGVAMNLASQFLSTPNIRLLTACSRRRDRLSTSLAARPKWLKSFFAVREAPGGKRGNTAWSGCAAGIANSQPAMCLAPVAPRRRASSSSTAPNGWPTTPSACSPRCTKYVAVVRVSNFDA